jgi:GntR family transcriptional regulator, transcriptional repressor for pyruvate dehydrogenase complex
MTHRRRQTHAAIHQAIRGGKPDDAASAAGVHPDNTLEDYRREIQRCPFG